MVLQIQILSTGRNYSQLAQEVKEFLERGGFEVELITNHTEIKPVLLCLVLGYYRIIPREYWEKPRYCLGFHASALPKGRGQAPINWAIIKGEKEIGVSLFKISEAVDSGDLLDQRMVRIEPWEVYQEVKKKVEATILDMVRTSLMNFLRNPRDDAFRPQKGKPSYYPRRTPNNSELKDEWISEELFNFLRACDNEKYPAFFWRHGRKFYLKLEPAESESPHP